MAFSEGRKSVRWSMLPSSWVSSEIPPAVMAELVKEKQKLQEILLHHVATADQESCGLRVNLHKHFGHPSALGMVQCARIIESDSKVCGGRVHPLDRVLPPPAGDVLATLQSGHPRFAELVRRAKMDGDLE